MKRMLFLGMIAMLMAFSSCGSGNSGGTPIALDEVVHNYDNEGQNVEVTGYLIPGSFSMVRDRRITVGLYESTARRKEVAKISMGFGQQARRIYMPEKFSESDIVIYDDENQKHGYDTKLKIIGSIKYTRKEWRNDLEVGELPKAVANNPTLKKTREDQAARARKAMEARSEKQNGDPNDYSFEIQLKSITAVE
jgi:hypothetical protein